MAWHDGRLCAFDTETTATDPEEARIVQAHTVAVGGGVETVPTDMLINPGVPIPEQATEVHGITDEMAANGQPAPGAIGTLAFGLSNAIRHGVPLVIFNARYDLTVMDRECRRHSIDPPPWQDARVVDPFVIDKWLDRFRKGSRTLGAMCEHYEIKLADAHDAGADALAAARLAYRLLHKTDAVQGRHPEIVQRRTFWKLVRDDLDALHSAQVGWAREQAIGLRSYFEGRGEVEKAASVSEDWPLIPAAVAA